MRKRSILITGGCGFVGSNLAEALVAEGCQITCLDNLSRRGSEILRKKVLGLGCSFVHGDIRSEEDLRKIRGDFDLMIECSAEPSVLVGSEGRDAAFMLRNNLVGSLNCFEYARERGLAVVFLSTSRVYPYTAINELTFEAGRKRVTCTSRGFGVSERGIGLDFTLAGYRSLYGATKLASEFVLQEYSKQYDVPAIIDRCGVLAGPGQLGRVDQGVFSFWIAAHHFGRPLKYVGFGGEGKQVRDLLHIADLTELLKIQLDRIEEFRGEVFNAGGSLTANLSLQETTDLCRQITGCTVEMGSEPATRPADVLWYMTDNAATTARFGWAPRHGPEKILGDFWSWLKENEADFRSVY